MTTPATPTPTPAQLEEARHPTAHDFEIWLMNLDDIVQENTGLSYKDMPDRLFRDWFDEDLTPEEAYTRLVDSLTPDLAIFNLFDSEPDELSTYVQEFDEFTDADPGL
jgi:hypothetical protein